VPDGFALLLEIALKIGAPTAENVNRFAHNSFNLANLHPLSSRTDVRALAKAYAFQSPNRVSQHQGSANHLRLRSRLGSWK
jgi:hypothetical protein